MQNGARAAPRRDDWGGGRGSFEVDSFHATSIGIMLKAEKFAGDRSPVPPVPPPMKRGSNGERVSVAMKSRAALSTITLLENLQRRIYGGGGGGHWDMFPPWAPKTPS